MKRKNKPTADVAAQQLRFAMMLRVIAGRLERGEAMVLRGEISEDQPTTISIADGRFLAGRDESSGGDFHVDLHVGARP